MADITTTSFSTIYDSFLTRVTDDMYMAWTKEDTLKALQNILINAIPLFEFPRFNIFDYTLGSYEEISEAVYDENGNLIKPAVYEWTGGFFNAVLTKEEVDILSLAMVVEWLGQQLTTTRNTRQLYTGSDFKITSQANHMKQLKEMKTSYYEECFHRQRLYKRRILVNGEVKSNAGIIVTTPTYGYNIND